METAMHGRHTSDSDPEEKHFRGDGELPQARLEEFKRNRRHSERLDIDLTSTKKTQTDDGASSRCLDVGGKSTRCTRQPPRLRSRAIGTDDCQLGGASAWLKPPRPPPKPVVPGRDQQLHSKPQPSLLDASVGTDTSPPPFPPPLSPPPENHLDFSCLADCQSPPPSQPPSQPPLQLPSPPTLSDASVATDVLPPPPSPRSLFDAGCLVDLPTTPHPIGIIDADELPEDSMPPPPLLLLPPHNELTTTSEDGSPPLTEDQTSLSEGFNVKRHPDTNNGSETPTRPPMNPEASAAFLTRQISSASEPKVASVEVFTESKANLPSLSMPLPPPPPPPPPQPQISAKTGEGDLKDAVVASKSSSSSVQCTLMKLVDTGAELTGPKADYSGSLLQKQQRQQKREQQRQESGESFFDQCEHRKQQQQQQQQQQDSQEPERKSGSEEAESEQPDSAAELNRLRSIIAELKGQLSVCQPNALELRQRRRQQSPRRRNVGLLVKPSCRDVGVNFVAESAKPIQRSVGVSVSLEAPVRGALNDGGGVEHIADSRSTSQDEDFATKSSPPPPPSPPPTPPPSPPQAIASHRQAAQNIIQQLQHTYGISTLELVNLVGQLRDVTNCGMQVSPDSRSIGTDSSAADAGCGECESPVRSHHHSGDEEKFEPSDGAFIPVEKSIALNCASLSIDKKNASNDSAKAQSRPTKRVRFHSPEAVRCLYNADDSSSSSQATEESAAEASTESSQEAYEPQESVVRACGTFVAWCKDSTGMSAAQLNDSLATIKQEWFRISSGPDTRLDQVTSFLQYLGHQGPQLLDKVVNMVDDNGNTGLHYAVSHRNWPLVNALLATGMARTDLYNRAGYSALILVGIHRLPPPPSPPTSTATVASAADADAAAAADDDDNNENNKDAMLEARRIARHLMLSGDVNARAVNSGRTALMLAASHGRTETLRLLLEVGALPNLQDDNGFTALMIAAQQGHLDCVRALLAHPGIDTQIQGKNGATALTVAMKNSHQEAALLVYAKNKLAGRSGLSLPVEKQNGRTHSRKAIPGSNR